LESLTFSRIVPKDFDSLLIRETTITNVKVYWKSMSEMIIPTSLYQETKNNKNYIFDAIKLEDLNNLMKKEFHEDYLIENFSIFSSCVMPLIENNDPINSRPKAALEILVTKLILNLKPEIIDNICSFYEYYRNIELCQKLRNYKPLTRPIILEKASLDEKDIKKRKLIVKDWILLSVWASRLKKIAAKQKVSTENTVPQLIQNVKLRIRCQQIIGNFYLKHNRSKIPILDLNLSNFAFESHFLLNKLDIKMLFQQFQINGNIFEITRPRPKLENHNRNNSDGHANSPNRHIPEMNIPVTSFGKFNRRKPQEAIISDFPNKPSVDSPKKPPLPKKPISSITQLRSIQIKIPDGYSEFIKKSLFSIAQTTATLPCFNLNLTSSWNMPNASTNIKLQISKINIDLFSNILNNLSELILDYREMYWFRHWPEIYNFIMSLFISSNKNTTHSAQFLMNVKHSEICIQFYEDLIIAKKNYIKNTPFFNFTAPASNFKYENINGNLQISAFGFITNCSKSMTFIQLFINNFFNQIKEQTTNKFLKQYYNFYEKLNDNISRKYTPQDIKIIKNRNGEENIPDLYDPDLDMDETEESKSVVRIRPIPGTGQNYSSARLIKNTPSGSRQSSNTSLTPASILSKTNIKAEKKPKKTVHFNDKQIENSNDSNNNEKDYQKPPAEILVKSQIDTYAKPTAFKQSNIPAELKFK